jgi:hypothetical protein
MKDYNDNIIMALFLYGAAYLLVSFTPLWWLGIITGIFAILLSIRIGRDILGNEVYPS